MNPCAITAILLAPDAGGEKRIYRVPAVRRLALLLRRAGIQRIHIIGRTAITDPTLSDLLPPEAFLSAGEGQHPANCIHSLSLNDDDQVLIMRADLVIDRILLDRMLAEAGKGPGVFMPAEKSAPGDGLYLTGAGAGQKIIEALWSCGLSPVESSAGLRVVRGESGLPCRAGDETSRRIAEEGLIRSLGGATTDDGFMARHVDRRVSRFFSRRLAHTRVSPNQITLIGMSIGLLGAFFLYLPDYAFRLSGALLFVLCVVIDGVDGEVARLKLMETDFGHALDIITDNVVHVAVFVGIGVGLYHQTGNSFYLHALGFLIAGFGLSAISVYCCILKRSPEEIVRFPRTMRLMTLLASRDFAYLVLIFAAFDRLAWFLTATSAGIYLFNALLWGFCLLEIHRQKPGFSKPYKIVKNDL